MAINECREANGEDLFRWKQGDLAKILAYRVYHSRGNPIDIEIPSESAHAWYKQGQRACYAKKGQLNMSCADCHTYKGRYADPHRLLQSRRRPPQPLPGRPLQME